MKANEIKRTKHFILSWDRIFQFSTRNYKRYLKALLAEENKRAGSGCDLDPNAFGARYLGMVDFDVSSETFNGAWSTHYIQSVLDRL